MFPLKNLACKGLRIPQVCKGVRAIRQQHQSSPVSCCGSPTHQSWQCHASDGADQFDCGPVVDVTVTHCELFRFSLVVVH